MQQQSSLKKQVKTFAQEKFSDVFPRNTLGIIIRCKQELSSKHSWRFVCFIPFIALLLGQFVHPAIFQFIPLPESTATTIVDQRTSNLATTFSITLVVIGWLITNISIKEAVSYDLLFKRAYIYPIFYYIISLISCMMLCSLFRHWSKIDIGNSVVSLTYLILIAFICIAFLFVRLIKVVGQNFFYAALEEEIMKEVRKKAKKEIITRKSNSIYESYIEKMGFIHGITFNTNLENHNGINITPYRVK